MSDLRYYSFFVVFLTSKTMYQDENTRIHNITQNYVGLQNGYTDRFLQEFAFNINFAKRFSHMHIYEYIRIYINILLMTFFMFFIMATLMLNRFYWTQVTIAVDLGLSLIFLNHSVVALLTQKICLSESFVFHLIMYCMNKNIHELFDVPVEIQDEEEVTDLVGQHMLYIFNNKIKDGNIRLYKCNSLGVV